MKSAHGFLLVYSVTSRTSFEQTRKFRTHILRMKYEDPHFPIVLVA
jgi:GTPase SAR1 family protein